VPCKGRRLESLQQANPVLIGNPGGLTLCVNEIGNTALGCLHIVSALAGIDDGALAQGVIQTNGNTGACGGALDVGRNQVGNENAQVSAS
jgi:hypothetical protein